MSLNKVILIGRAGKDPEGDKVVNLSLATSMTYKDKSGNRIDETEWHKIVFFGKLADIVMQYVIKGSLICVEGRIKSSKYEDKDGIKRTSYQIIASEMKMLGSKNEGRCEQPKQYQPQQQEMDVNIPNDDIPF